MRGVDTADDTIKRKGSRVAAGASEWPRAALVDVVEFIRGVSFDKSEAKYRPVEGHVPVLRAGNIGKGLALNEDLVWVPPSRVADDQMLRVGDIAICMSSGSPAVVGKTAQLREPWRGSVGAFCGIIRPRQHVHPDFLLLWFQADAFREWRDGQSRGANIQNLRFSQLAALEIPIPELSEQKRIAARLTEQLAAVERSQAAAAARLDAAEALSGSYLREVFGVEAPISASPIVPSTPTRTGWRWHRLADLARLATGHTPSRREPAWWGGEIPWLQLPDIRAVDGRRVTETMEYTNELGLANSSAVLLPAGTVCMSRTASVGFVTIMGRDMATSQDFVNWVCGPQLDPDFLMYLLIRSRRVLREMGSGATHHSIYFETVREFSVCVPAIAEQRKIVADLTERLTRAERTLDAIRSELAAIEALPAALLREAFKGTS